MALTLSKVAAKEVLLTIPVGEEVVNIVYYPMRMTERVFADINKLNSVTDNKSLGEGFHAFNDVFIRLIKSWDLYEEDEVTMYPITQERLSELPIFLRKVIIDAIVGDIRPEALMPSPAASPSTEKSLSLSLS